MKKVMLIFFAVSLLISATIGLFETPDSYFYTQLGRYLLEGHFEPALPFNTTSPTTLFAPVYALFIWILRAPYPFIGRVTIPFVQLILLGLSALMLYRVVQNNLPRPLPVGAVILFFLLPYNIAYATLVMSEILAQFLITVLLYIFYKHTKGSHWANPPILVFLSSILVLTRYAYISIFALSFCYWLYWTVRQPGKNLKRPVHLFAMAGVGLLVIWGLFNYNTTGRFSLSSAVGRHLYNNVVTLGRLLPEESDPLYQEFIRRFPQKDITKYRPWWENQMYFNYYTESQMDNFYLRLSLSAIARSPLEYAGNVARAAALIPMTAPYHETGWQKDAGACGLPLWFPWWTKYLPDSRTVVCPIQHAWATYLTIESITFPNGAIVLIALSALGLIEMLATRKFFVRSCALVFMLAHGFNSATEWIEGRFLIPLYPLYAIAIVYGVYVLLTRVHAYFVAGKTS